MAQQQEQKQEIKIITKCILDFDDALFPSHRYKYHNILKYHESSSKEGIHFGRDKFQNECETDFIKLKKDIDLVIFKLMQRYSKDNFIILSTGNYQWIKSTLKYYQYLLSAYNVKIYSTQEYHSKHPNHFDINNSLQSKKFIMQSLLKKWKFEESQKDCNKNKIIKFRLISIGDSFFEFLACYNIGFDYVNRIKLIEEPTVKNMIKLWQNILYFTKENIYNQNIVFLNENQYYYLNEKRLNILNQQCLDRLNKTKKNVIFQPLFDIITNGNDQCYQIIINHDNNNKKQLQHKKILKKKQTPQPQQPQQQAIINNQSLLFQQQIIQQQIIQQQHQQHYYYQQQQQQRQQQILYAQQLLQQHQQMQSQFLFDV